MTDVLIMTRGIENLTYLLSFRHLGSLNLLLRKREKGMLQKTTDTCHIAVWKEETNNLKMLLEQQSLVCDLIGLRTLLCLLRLQEGRASVDVFVFGSYSLEISFLLYRSRLAVYS